MWTRRGTISLGQQRQKDARDLAREDSERSKATHVGSATNGTQRCSWSMYMGVVKLDMRNRSSVSHASPMKTSPRPRLSSDTPPRKPVPSASRDPPETVAMLRRAPANRSTSRRYSTAAPSNGTDSSNCEGRRRACIRVASGAHGLAASALVEKDHKNANRLRLT